MMMMMMSQLQWQSAQMGVWCSHELGKGVANGDAVGRLLGSRNGAIAVTKGHRLKHRWQHLGHRG